MARLNLLLSAAATTLAMAAGILAGAASAAADPGSDASDHSSDTSTSAHRSSSPSDTSVAARTDNRTNRDLTSATKPDDQSSSSIPARRSDKKSPEPSKQGQDGESTNVSEPPGATQFSGETEPPGGFPSVKDSERPDNSGGSARSGSTGSENLDTTRRIPNSLGTPRSVDSAALPTDTADTTVDEATNSRKPLHPLAK